MRRPQTSAVIMLSNMWCQWRYQDVILQMNNIPMSHDSQLMWFHSMRVYLNKMKYCVVLCFRFVGTLLKLRVFISDPQKWFRSQDNRWTVVSRHLQVHSARSRIDGMVVHGTLSPTLREVENCPTWKETNIGDTPIFHGTMIMKVVG